MTSDSTNTKDECEHSNCPTNSRCQALPYGGFYCICNNGYAGSKCKDINECDNGSHECHPLGDCINTKG